ncbi:1618_t:CDS:2 [Funneliformis mosseae]|uniref:1618_t:CDS:1 n=1 Tax=Funneliformis mosseae TaxID=27381 RepID=A0A9N9AVM1_FUNMO|nr:1618_t:CDS:2 [Funneliformis mosseae]
MKSFILLQLMMQFFLANIYGQKDPNCDSVNDPCVLANSILHPCKGQLVTIPPEALSGAAQFQYKFSKNEPDLNTLYYCSCSVKFYNLVVNCTTCFQGPGTSITVEPFQDFANACADAGFAIELQQPKAPKPRKVDKYCGTVKDPCKLVNSTLSPCGGYFPSPTPEELNGGISSIYKLASSDISIFPCACNAELYSLFYRCTTCFMKPGNDITMEPLDDYKATCIEAGLNFEVFSDDPQPLPTSTSSTSTTTTSTSTTKPPSPTPTPPIVKDPSCNTDNDPCSAINNLLKPCNGILYPPSKVTNGTYKPDGNYLKIFLDPNLLPCMCTARFYNELVKCMTCFVPEYNITVVPVLEYGQICKTSSNDGSSLTQLKDSSLLLNLCITFMVNFV